MHEHNRTSSEVLVSGTWADGRPLTWEGTATSEELVVAAAVLRQPDSICWAKARPSRSHALKLLLHPLEFVGSRVQPIFYVGSGFLTQTIECMVERSAPPAIEASLVVPSMKPVQLARLSDRPATTVHLLFIPKPMVKVARNHIWRPKPDALESLEEPFRSAMAAGRAGRMPAA